MKKIAILIALFYLLAVPAIAEETQSPSKFRSYINDVSCGEIIKGLEDQAARRAYVLMVGSFISGTNYAKNRDSKVELQRMLILTEQFCRQNPEQPMMTAMIFLDKAIDKAEEAKQQ